MNADDPPDDTNSSIPRRSRTALDTVAGYVAIIREELSDRGIEMEEFSIVDRAMADILAAVRDLERDAFQADRRAKQDPLTGLANRRHLVRLGERWMGTESPLCALVLDLDGFKAVNDTFGHAVGDAVLVQVAERLSRSVRQGDLLSRIGGDEFVVLLQGDARAARRVRARIQESIADPPYRVGEVEVQLSVSAGLVMRRDRHSSLYELLKEADLRMYRRKEAANRALSRRA